MQLKHFIYFLFPALIALVIFFSLFGGTVWGITPEQLIEKIKQEPERQVRYELTRTLVDKAGPSQAISLLNEIRQSDIPGLYLSEIHLLTHIVGEEAYKRYGHAALFHCEDDIQNGCTHGVFLRATSEHGLGGVNAILGPCKSEPNYKYQIWCLHGAGHAFLAMSGYGDLPWALEQCDLLDSRGRERPDSCYQGVFMENVHGEHGGTEIYSKPWLSEDELFMPCDRVEAHYRDQCYIIQPGWWLVNLKDMDKTAELCDKAPVENRRACAGGVGLMIHAKNKTEDSKVMAAGCRRYFKESILADACLNTVSRGIFIYHEYEIAIDFCRETLTEEGRTDCYKLIGEKMSEYEFSEEKMSELCGRFEVGFRRFCESKAD